MHQDYTLCDSTELLIVDGTKKLTLFAFDNCISEVAATPNPTEHQLLTAPPISEIVYDQQKQNNTIAIIT